MWKRNPLIVSGTNLWQAINLKCIWNRQKNPSTLLSGCAAYQTHTYTHVIRLAGVKPIMTVNFSPYFEGSSKNVFLQQYIWFYCWLLPSISSSDKWIPFLFWVHVFVTRRRKFWNVCILIYCTYVYIYIYVHISIFVCIYVHICIHISVYVCIYVYISIYVNIKFSFFMKTSEFTRKQIAN